jgi:putative Mg2+ transporter-C (MgtC) family protein
MQNDYLTIDLTLRVVVAIVLGAAIGFERQWRLRTAGIRTNALVSAGASLFVMIGTAGFGDEGAGVDPTRVAAQVVSGIGFLGAGVILRDGTNIRGLTTAATLWCAAAVGSLAGAGMLWMATIGALAILVTNTLLRPLSRVLNRRSQRLQPDVVQQTPSTDYMLEIVATDKSEQRLRALLLDAVDRPELTLRSIDSKMWKNSQIKLLAGLSSEHGADTSGIERVLQRMTLDPKVSSSRWWTVDTED